MIGFLIIRFQLYSGLFVSQLPKQINHNNQRKYGR